MTNSTADAVADCKPSNTKRSYSIRSLMVIITLIAVWLAIPRHSQGRNYGAVLFFTSHQIGGWILVSSFIWVGSGRRRLVLGLLVAVLSIAWLPALCVIVTEPFLGPTFVGEVLAKVGLIEAYTLFYDYLDQSFGYGLRY